MIWTFERGDEIVRLETRVDNDTREYVVVITWADRPPQTERYADVALYNVRILALEAQLAADHWSLVGRLLTPHFRVIAPDLPGFGDSTRRLDAHYGVEEQLARIAAFADTLGLARFHLGGNSMGGYLAMLFAARHPERVMSLWLLAPAGALSAEPSETLNLIAAGDNPLVATDSAAFDRLAALCFCRQPYLPAQFKRPLLARSIAEAPFNSKIFADMFTAPLALETAIADLPVRSLMVWGDYDRILHPSGLDVLRPLFRDVECILMRDMGHAPMLERPAETAMDFLRFHGRLR